MRLSMLRDTIRPLGNSRTAASSTPASPTRTRASASALVAAPTSIQRSEIFDPLSLLLFFHQMHGLCAVQAEPDLLRPGIPAALPHDPRGAPPADRGEVEVPLVVVVRSLDPALVDGPRQHQPRPALGVERRDRV